MFALGIIVFLVVVFAVMGAWQRRLDRDHKKRAMDELREAVHRGSNKPLAQFPQINPYLCIGCGSCIEACPEDDVIGLVNGIAHIVHGSRCVGHGHCEFACPVSAIKVGLGNIALRPDIPILSSELESSIPNVFIAGELGGISLIRNAIAQGAQVVDTIAARFKDRPRLSGQGGVDVLIVGAGPAGLSASLRAKERKLTAMTISQEEMGGAVRKYPRRKLTLVQSVSIPLYGVMKGGEYEKEQLIALWEDIIRKFGLTIQSGTGLLHIQREGDSFNVETTRGSYRAGSIVLALGRRGTPRTLGVPGEEASKVFYQLIDTTTYRQMKLLVVGGGDSAVEAATGLANQLGNSVTLSYRKENFFRLKSRNEARVREYMAQKKLQVLFNSQIQKIDPKAVTLTVEMQGRQETVSIPNDYVFVFAGGDPPYPLLKKIGIRFGAEPAPSRLS